MFYTFWLYGAILVSAIFPVAYALPSPSPQGAGTSSTTPSSSASASARTSTGANSGATQMSGIQLAIMLSAIGGVIIGITILIFLRQWSKKRSLGARNKEDDQEPLSASFQPGELPTLSYWPEAKPPPSHVLA